MEARWEEERGAQWEETGGHGDSPSSEESRAMQWEKVRGEHWVVQHREGEIGAKWEEVMEAHW